MGIWSKTFLPIKVNNTVVALIRSARPHQSPRIFGAEVCARAFKGSLRDIGVLYTSASLSFQGSMTASNVVSSPLSTAEYDIANVLLVWKGFVNGRRST